MYPKIKIHENIEFSTFPILIGVGILFMLLYIIREFEKSKTERKELFDVLTIVALSLVAAFFFAFVFDSLFHSMEEGRIVLGGITYIGGFLGGIFSFWLLIKIIHKATNDKILSYLHIIIPAVVIAHFFGRIGCFLGGCCFGKPTDSVFGVVFPEGSPAVLEYGHPVKVFPTQLFEAAALLVIFLVLIRLKNYLLLTYFIAYATVRFMLEFLRGDSRGSVKLPVSPSQLLSVFMIVGGILLAVLINKVLCRQE